MKSTRKYLLAVCALAIGFAAPAIHAEEGGTPPPKKEMRGGPVERILGLKEKLGLTEAQVTQLKKIGEDHRTAMKALREKEGDRDSKKDDAKKIQEATKTKVDAVLTAEQKAKLEEIKKNRPEGGHPGGPDGEKGSKDGKGPKGPAPAGE
jgi:Spy/CpxP family protein refolding chaperone